MDIDYVIFFKTCKINISVPLQRNIHIMSQFNLNVAAKLLNKEAYHVESNVSDETFQNFLNFWTKGEEPLINSDNASDYYLLSEEIGLMKDIVLKHINEDVLHISCLQKLDAKPKDKEKISHDKSNNEKYAAKNLDKLIKKYPDHLMKIPINSLYNIFYNPQRVLTNTQKAYEFIDDLIKTATIHNNENKLNYFVLFSSLNGDDLDDKTKLKILSKTNDYFGFIPKFSPSFYKSIEENYNSLELNKKQLEFYKTELNKEISENLEIKKCNEQMKEKLSLEIKKLSDENQKLKSDNEQMYIEK